jgi:[ribosomal protein S5]-alanine N-acetyltransferase
MSEMHPGWPTILRAGPVSLRPPRRRDAREWSRIRVANESWLAQWEPTSVSSWRSRNSPREYQRSLSAMRSSARIGTMLPFLIWYGDRLSGQMTVSNVTRGALRSCSIGYWVDSAIAGLGVTPTALALLIDHCLTTVGLHRVEVDIRPENSASLRVVEKLGLRREALYERYLDIGGGWRDHIGFAITVEERGSTPVIERLSKLPVPPE